MTFPSNDCRNGLVVPIEDDPAAKKKDGQGGAQRIARADLSSDQREVYQSMASWVARKDDPLLKVGGYAGTGKSTLVAVLAREAFGSTKVAFCAYSGKAGNVLRQKLRAAGVNIAGSHCGTIHSLIYTPNIEKKTGRLLGFTRLGRIDEKLVVVDEASMIGEEIWADLSSYKLKVLAVGDHGQLPPVGNDRINLMEQPDLRLEVIHRQARGNPILALAELVRGGGHPMDFVTSDRRRANVVRGVDFGRARDLYNITTSNFLDRAVLCYKNATRSSINMDVRRALGFSGILQEGEVVICLRNTTLGEVRIFNGMRGLVEKVVPDGEHYLRVDVAFPDDGLRLKNGRVLAHQFGRNYTFREYKEVSKAIRKKVRSWKQAGLLFDYGYAMTVHKSQGSQFKQVLMIAEPGFRGEGADKRARWLYTGVTRAAKYLEVHVP